MEGTGEARRASRWTKTRGSWRRRAVGARTALNAIDAPAFVVDLGGEVLHANTNAQVLLDRDRPGVSRSLVEAVAGRPAGGWELTPLRGSEQQRGFLAIMRPSRHPGRRQDDTLWPPASDGT